LFSYYSISPSVQNHVRTYPGAPSASIHVSVVPWSKWLYLDAELSLTCGEECLGLHCHANLLCN